MRRLLEKLGISGKSADRLSTEKARDAVERLIENTEPRIRLVPGYDKKLLPPVAGALHYIDSLVEQIPGPLDMNRAAFVDDPQVNACFVSPDDLQRVFSESKELKTFFKDPDHDKTEHAYALLCACRKEKTVLGMDLADGNVRRDVMQTVISFSGHKILSPAAGEKEVRQGIKNCIYDGLVTYALRHITDLKSARRDLEDNRRILQARLRARRVAVGGLSALLAGAGEPAADIHATQEQLAETERELGKMPASQDLLKFYLQEIIGILSRPDDFIRLDAACFRLTRMGVKVEGDSRRTANTVCFTELEVAKVMKQVVVLVRYPRDEMQSPASGGAGLLQPT